MSLSNNGAQAFAVVAVIGDLPTRPRTKPAVIAVHFVSSCDPPDAA